MRRWVETVPARATWGALTLAGCLTAWLAVSGAESPEAHAVKEQLALQVRRVESLEVSYKLETKTSLRPEQLVTLADFRNQLFLPQEEWQIAFKGVKRYQRQIQPERVTYLRPTDKYGLVPPPPVDPKSPSWFQQRDRRIQGEYDQVVAPLREQEARGLPARRRDPGIRDRRDRDVTRAFNGRSLWLRRPRSETVDEYQIRPGTPEANWFQVSAYQSAVGLHVPDPSSKGSRAGKIQAMFQVAEWVREKSYELEEKTEVIDGSTCVVLKGSLNSLFQLAQLLVGDMSDRIWLDRDHGLAVRKREFSKGGRVIQRWENSEFREVEPGFWLPTQIRHHQFAADSPPDLANQPVLAVEIQVLTIELNRVPDDRFDMAPRKGDVIEDQRGSL